MQNQIICDSFGIHNSNDRSKKQNSEEQNLTQLRKAMIQRDHTYGCYLKRRGIKRAIL